jgi:serine/threonine protein phosphatase 1
MTDHGMVVVHGHTIVDQPEEHPNRIAMDTGAYRTGKLSAIGIEGRDRWFIQAALGSAERRYRAS